MRSCLRNDNKYRAGVPIDDRGHRRVRFNPHVQMNLFDDNVEPLNFVNSHTDKYVPCNHCEAEDIPASMRIQNAINRDLTNPWCRDSHTCNTLYGGDGEKVLNINNTTSIYIDNTLDIDYDNPLRGDKSMYKGVDRLRGREPVNMNASEDGDMRESDMNTPSTEGGYPSNTSDAYSMRHLLNTVHRDDETGLLYRVIDIYDDRQLRLAKCRRALILPDGNLSTVSIDEVNVTISISTRD